MKFGRKIRDFRLELGLSQSAFAKKLGISQVSISAIELDDRSPSFTTLKKLDRLAKKSGYLIDLLGD